MGLSVPLCVFACVCVCVCVCKFYKPNTVGAPSSEIKASASILLRPRPNGATRPKLTHWVWREGRGERGGGGVTQTVGV